MPKPQIILLSHKVLFNTEFISMVDGLTISDTSELYSLLLLNISDNLSGIKTESELTIFFNQKDQSKIPDQYLLSAHKFFDPLMGLSQLTSFIQKKIHSGNTQFILIYADTIGFSNREYDKIINYLNYEDNCLVLGSSENDKLSLIGFNYFDERLFDKQYELNPQFTDFLKRANTLDYYLFIHNGYPAVSDLEDFRKLYRILSTKESIEFCSHELHERFTHLFIEYKELLK